MLDVELLDEETFNYIAERVEIFTEKDFYQNHMNYRKVVLPNDFESFRLTSAGKDVLYMVGNRSPFPITPNFLSIGFPMKVGDESNYLFHVHNDELYCTKFGDDFREDTALGIGVQVNYYMDIKSAQKGSTDSNPILLPKVCVQSGPENVTISKMCFNTFDAELWRELKYISKF
jgi:hypothetical protein